MGTVLISFAALVVASFSLYVSAEKFRLDLYNRRFDIYMRTVKFYWFLLKPKERGEPVNVDNSIQNDFIIATRESRFLFSAESGVYDLLSRLNAASFKLLRGTLPQGLPIEYILQDQKEFSDALLLWNSSIEHLEDLMAPYLNYHYVSTWLAFLKFFENHRRRIYK